MPALTRSLTTRTARRLISEWALPANTGNRMGAEIEWFTRPCPPVPILRSFTADTVLPHGSKITFEPGGQVELSSLPFDAVADVCTALERDTAAVRDVLGAHGITLR